MYTLQHHNNVVNFDKHAASIMVNVHRKDVCW